MLRGDRSTFTALGLAAFVLLASIGSFLLYSRASALQTEYEISAQNGAKDYAKRSSEVIEGRCLPLAGEKEVDCINEERDIAREGYRKEYDLEAQRITAVWTAHMGIAAIIGMAASLIGVGLVWVTFRETRKAASVSEKTYKAFIAIESPRLVPAFGAIERKTDGSVAFNLSFTNIGKSSCVVTFGLWASRKTNDFNEIKGYTSNPIHILIDAGKTERVARIYLQSLEVDETPYWGGLVVYQSAIAEKHRTYFCHQFIKESSDPQCRVFSRDMKDGSWPNDE